MSGRSNLNSEAEHQTGKISTHLPDSLLTDSRYNFLAVLLYYVSLDLVSALFELDVSGTVVGAAAY